VRLYVISKLQLNPLDARLDSVLSVRTKSGQEIWTESRCTAEYIRHKSSPVFGAKTTDRSFHELCHEATRRAHEKTKLFDVLAAINAGHR
jgi:hypothetical protein